MENHVAYRMALISRVCGGSYGVLRCPAVRSAVFGPTVNRRILKFFPLGVTLPQNNHFGRVSVSQAYKSRVTFKSFRLG